jgi:hypothetical protein
MRALCVVNRLHPVSQCLPGSQNVYIAVTVLTDVKPKIQTNILGFRISLSKLLTCEYTFLTVNV